MRRNEREKARRVSEYVDALVLHQRVAAGRRAPSGEADGGEIGELVNLAKTLTEIELRPPEGFADELERKLPVLASRSPLAADRWSWPSGIHRLLRRAVEPASNASRAFQGMAAAVLIAAVFGIILVGPLSHPRPVSAAEILNRADEALASLVRPGETLYRHWRVVSRIAEAPGALESIQEQIVQEWMDGSDFDHVASRVNAIDGRLLWAFANAREGGELRSKLYFAPGFSDERAGLLNIEPTMRELHQAIAQLPEEERATIQRYVDLGYIYEPIRGEQRFNRAMLQSASNVDPRMPRIVLSLDRAAEVRGAQVFKVRVVHPGRIRARWRREGPPVVRILKEETVRYVDRDSYLGVKTETLSEYEDGRRVFTTRDLVETRVIKTRADALEPFDIEVPPGTPTRRQSAVEHLTEVWKKLGVSTASSSQ